MRGPAVRTDAILGRPDYTQGVVLASSVGQSFIPPAGSGFVNFSFNADVWVAYGSTAAGAPSTTTTAGTSSSELNPTMRNFTSTQACSVISIKSDSDCKGSLSWFAPA